MRSLLVGMIRIPRNVASDPGSRPNPEARVPNPGGRAECPRRSARAQLVPGARSQVPDRGSSLLEALVAVGLIAGALVAAADLAGAAVRSLAAARDRSNSTLIAAQKVEQLLASPSRPAPSPGAALETDTPGFVEYLDARGRVSGLDDGCEGTVYARRWSVAPLPRDPRVVVIQARAGRCRRVPQTEGSCAALANGARLAAARVEGW